MNEKQQHFRDVLFRVSCISALSYGEIKTSIGLELFTFPGFSDLPLISVIQHHPLLAKTEWGFDFLGYHFGPEGFTIAQKTLDSCVERAIRLYEQEPGESCCSTRLGST